MPRRHHPSRINRALFASFYHQQAWHPMPRIAWQQTTITADPARPPAPAKQAGQAWQAGRQVHARALHAGPRTPPVEGARGCDARQCASMKAAPYHAQSAVPISRAGRQAGPPSRALPAARLGGGSGQHPSNPISSAPGTRPPAQVPSARARPPAGARQQLSRHPGQGWHATPSRAHAPHNPRARPAARRRRRGRPA